MLKDKYGIPIIRIASDKITKYELSLLLARRSRIINQKRVDMENHLGQKIIEKEKPINQATRELIDGTLQFEYRKEEQEQVLSPKISKTVI